MNMRSAPVKMKNWTVHWLDASGNLDDHHSPIVEALQSAYAVLSRYAQIPKMDVLIQRADGHTIPELGISGRAYRASLFALSFDPNNPNFANSLLGGALVRQIVHEVHHCLRMAGQGYGKTFGEALVSEGLAGRFVQHVMQSQPELWEAAVPISELKAFMVKKRMLSEVRYDHSRWFFGRGSIPRWFGYTLGYEIVGNWLITVGADTVDWINVPACVPITAAIESGLIAKD